MMHGSSGCLRLSGNDHQTFMIGRKTVTDKSERAAMKTKYDAFRAAAKPPEVALVANMRKLFNALIRDGRLWSPLSA